MGLSTVDVLYGVADFPFPNSKVVANSQNVMAGGPAANASIAFAHLAGSATLVTKAGRHAVTSVIREDLHRHGVQLIDLDPAFDGVPIISSICVDRAGDRNVVSTGGTSPIPLPVLADQEVLASAAILMVDGHYMPACRAWATAAHALGKAVVLDGGSWKDGTAELLESVHTAICSADFLPPGCSTAADVFGYLQCCGVAEVAITNGAEPIRFLSNGTSGIVQVPRIEAVDTMGAGDIFHGAFGYYVAAGLGFVEALGEAARIAAESCRFHGTRTWMKLPVSPVATR